MSTPSTRALAAEWLDAKKAEAEAIAFRRAIEDSLVKSLQVSEQLDGTENFERDGYVIKVTGRINRTVNSDLLQDAAAEHGLTEHLSSLFRWKPEINMSAWKAADSSITAPLTAAITAKPGRPSFAITKLEK